jgi:hypothetical protein
MESVHQIKLILSFVTLLRELRGGLLENGGTSGDLEKGVDVLFH